MSSEALVGKRLSPGLALGAAWVVQNNSIDLQKSYKKSNTENEKSNWKKSLAQVEKDLTLLEEKSRNESAEQADIIAAHKMLLQDPEWQDQIEQSILNEQVSAPEAVKKITQSFAEMMAALDDDYLKERAHDILDVGQRVINNLLGISTNIMPDTGSYILVATDMTPSQFASLDKKRVLGLVMEQGGVTSHIAIMARIYEIPTLSGIDNAINRIKNSDLLFLQADKSHLYINPTNDQKKQFEGFVTAYTKSKEELYSLKEKESKTIDGTEVFLEANIGSESDLQLVKKYGAQGIGLFRTEFLFFDRTQAPSETEQYNIYTKVAKAVSPHPTVVRTFDIGADKLVPYIHWPKEENPFLGLRALRYCLKEPELFKTQLRALLKASCEYPLSVMFPMVSSVDELRAAKVILKQCEEELKLAKKPQIKLGIMIEVPSAALIADQLAKECDFFSIGTNDLIQYVCAVDRMNESVAHLYQSFHPGVLNLVSQVIEAGRKHGTEVAMCGEMAADLELIPLLVGMGLRVFSQSPSTVLRSKKLIRKLDSQKCQNLWSAVRNFGSAAEIHKACQEFSNQL